MRLSEAVCYALNIRGRHFARRIERHRARAADPAFVACYLARFGLGAVDAQRYVQEAGSFLERYQGAIRAYARSFPDPDCFRDRDVLVIGAGRGVDVLHLGHDRGARRVIGVDIDADLCRFSRRMLEDHGVANASIICADMASVPAIPSESIDHVVSIATFEHIHDLQGTLIESHRVLRPGGTLHAEFSPIWRHYYGSHLSKYLPFPWTHLLFGEETVRNTLARLQRLPQPPSIYAGLNRLSLRDYCRIVEETPFQIVEFRMVTDSSVKRILHRVPVVNELVAGGMRMRLQKTA